MKWNNKRDRKIRVIQKVKFELKTSKHCLFANTNKTSKILSRHIILCMSENVAKWPVCIFSVYVHKDVYALLILQTLLYTFGTTVFIELLV